MYKGNLTNQLTTAGNLSHSDVNDYIVLRGALGGLCSEHFYNGYKVILPSSGSGGPLVAKTMSYLNLSGPVDTPLSDVGDALIAGNFIEILLW